MKNLNFGQILMFQGQIWYARADRGLKNSSFHDLNLEIGPSLVSTILKSGMPELVPGPAWATTRYNLLLPSCG